MKYLYLSSIVIVIYHAAVAVLQCCRISRTADQGGHVRTPELSLEEQSSPLRFSPPALVWECPGWPGWGNVQETVVVTRMTGAGPQAVMRSRIISIILHCGDRLQSVACHLQPVVTTFITLSYHSYNSYNSCPNLTWFLSIYHITSDQPWCHQCQVTSHSPLSSAQLSWPSPACLCSLHQDPAPDSVLTVYSVCCMCTALLTNW